MSNVFGKQFQISIFGESHSAAIGVIIDGIPAGTRINMDKVEAAMKRRAPSTHVGSTKRREADRPEILSGCVDNATTGTPLCAMIWNNDTRSRDYVEMSKKPRPGHADYTGYIKYKGRNDIRGGGHFSGRLTAPIVFAGSVAEQILEQKNIIIAAHIKQIADVRDSSLLDTTDDKLTQLIQKDFCVLDDQAGVKMQQAIECAVEECDSVGGTVECVVYGSIPVGIGEPFFDSIESELAHMLFSIPAVKGVEFGQGFSFANMRGSQANDALHMDGSRVTFETNYNGGINGGISNGMPIVFSVAVKPTPSIGKRQHTVDMILGENSELEIKGRHDACIVPRAVEVIRACAAIVVLDLYLRSGIYE